MKMTILRIVLPLACLAALASGCIYDSLHSQVVVTEKVAVTFMENLTSPTLSSSVVSDKFRERILEAIAEQGATLEDIESITMEEGSYKVTMPSKAGHDWVISGTVTVARQDDPMGPVTAGPETFIVLDDQSLAAAKGKPVLADLDEDGVAIVNAALADLLEGATPRLVITLQSSSITPAPSASDPLKFGWLAQVTFQAVVNVEVGAGK